MTVLIEADNISLSHKNRLILDRISMHIKRNEIVTIIGPNGAGKTSLIRILTRMLKPDSGNVSYPRPVTLGYMPQKLHINPSMPIDVSSFLNIKGIDASLLNKTLDDLSLRGIYQQSMHDLSGGERQRVLLARAILRKPDLLVLDEPAQGVDVAGQTRLYELIDSVRKQYSCSVLMISHDLHWVMAKTDRVICLNQHICCHGHPDIVSNNDAYLSLFSDQTPTIAHYTHHHDHHHDLHGGIIDGEHSKDCQHDH